MTVNEQYGKLYREHDAWRVSGIGPLMDKAFQREMRMSPEKQHGYCVSIRSATGRRLVVLFECHRLLDVQI